MLVNKTEAAKLAGVSKTTIYSHIKQNKLSTQDGKIDTAELEKVYGELTEPTERSVEHSRNTDFDHKTADLEKDLAVERMKTRGLERELNVVNRQNDDLRQSLAIISNKPPAQEEEQGQSYEPPRVIIDVPQEAPAQGKEPEGATSEYVDLFDFIEEAQVTVKASERSEEPTLPTTSGKARKNAAWFVAAISVLLVTWLVIPADQPLPAPNPLTPAAIELWKESCPEGEKLLLPPDGEYLTCSRSLSDSEKGGE